MTEHSNSKSCGVSPLWTSAEIEAATGGRANAAFDVTGATFDSREVQPGDLFVAMPGTVHDGHKFVDGAFAAGAAGAIVSQPVDGPHILVDDTAKALEDLGRAARERSAARGQRRSRRSDGCGHGDPLPVTDRGRVGVRELEHP